MASGTRSRLLRIAVFVLVIAAVRELSIRRHMADLHDWPRVDGGGGRPR